MNSMFFLLSFFLAHTTITAKFKLGLMLTKCVYVFLSFCESDVKLQSKLRTQICSVKAIVRLKKTDLTEINTISLNKLKDSSSSKIDLSMVIMK